MGERGRETLIQSPLGLKVRRDRAHVPLGATKRGRGKSVMGAGPPSFAIAARGGAFVDERRIVGGNVGERGCETLIQSRLGLKVRRDRAHAPLGVPSKSGGMSSATVRAAGVPFGSLAVAAATARRAMVASAHRKWPPTGAAPTVRSIRNSNG